MHALRRVQAALVPGGLLVDTQPLSPAPPVEVDGRAVGTLDMRAWAATIDAVDRRTQQVVADGLLGLEHEERLVVTDLYDSGPEFLELVEGWKGTRVPGSLRDRLTGAGEPVALHQDVRLRLYRV